jgi:uncharacterized protein YkwD
VPPRQDADRHAGAADPLDRFDIAGREPPPEPEPRRGPGRALRVAGAVVAVAVALLAVPHLIGTGPRPQLGEPAPAAGGEARPGAAPPRTSAPRPTPVRTITPRTTAPRSSAPTTSTAYDQQILALVNAARRDGGCRSLVLDSRLQTAARGHTRDMAEHSHFSHTGTDGSTPTKRAAAQGFTGSVGENIASGYADAEAVMRAWMNSSGHRANILNCDYRLLGVGYVPTGAWWTELFGG